MGVWLLRSISSKEVKACLPLLLGIVCTGFSSTTALQVVIWAARLYSSMQASATQLNEMYGHPLGNHTAAHWTQKLLVKEEYVNQSDFNFKYCLASVLNLGIKHLAAIKAGGEQGDSNRPADLLWGLEEACFEGTALLRLPGSQDVQVRVAAGGAVHGFEVKV